jgi:predicted dienelactone hydrolase
MGAFNRILQAFLAGAAVVSGGYLSCAGAPLQAQTDLSAEGRLAVETIAFADLADPLRGRHVPIKVHLPAGDKPVPVVIVSHGGGGHWDANYAQAHHLASHGYAVLALEHVGSNTDVIKRAFAFMANLKAMTRDPDEVLGRPKDVSFAIDRAEEWNRVHPRLRGRLDVSRVGVLGHSFGAYTVLVVAGMRPALNWLVPAVPPGKGLGPDLRDNRVVCGVALSPQGPGEPFFIEESYASLKTPLLGISGSKDMQQGAPPENRRRAYALWPPGDTYLIWLSNADHTAFSDSTGSHRRMLPSAARDDVQPVVRAATLLFFNAYLKSDAAAKNSLSQEGLAPYLRGAVNAIEVMRK